MATPLETYFKRINPVMFPTDPTQTQASRIKLFNAWDALSRQLFLVAPIQLNRTRSYINGLAKIAG